MTDINSPPTPEITPQIAPERLTGILEFFQAAAQLKDTIRSGFTGQGRPESTAEHSWRLALMVLLFEQDLGDVDVLKLLKLCLIHDLGEVLSGDVPAPQQRPDDDRQARERRDFQTLCEPLSEDLSTELLAIWDEYSEAKTQEARYAKAFDKLETIFQHLLMPPPSAGFYRFNLTYGRDRTDVTPLTRQIRAVADAGTRAVMRSFGREPA